MSDRSLDDFVPSTDESGGGDGDGVGDDAPDPATPTARWASEAVCDACGTAVSWRWRDDDDYVCADCKSW